MGSSALLSRTAELLARTRSALSSLHWPWALENRLTTYDPTLGASCRGRVLLARAAACYRRRRRIHRTRPCLRRDHAPLRNNRLLRRRFGRHGRLLWLRCRSRRWWNHRSFYRRLRGSSGGRWWWWRRWWRNNHCRRRRRPFRHHRRGRNRLLYRRSYNHDRRLLWRRYRRCSGFGRNDCWLFLYRWRSLRNRLRGNSGSRRWRSSSCDRRTRLRRRRMMLLQLSFLQ